VRVMVEAHDATLGKQVLDQLVNEIKGVIDQ
jgi:hypothetical protein